VIVGEILLSLDFSRFTLILTAGAVALFSPCGYPMLPGYISYYLGLKNSPTKAFFGGLSCTLGLVTIFLGFGVVVSIVGSLIYPYIPYFELIAGIIVFIMGIVLLGNISLPFPNIGIGATKYKGAFGLYSYGLLYGLATLSCTAPIFISIFLMALSTGGIMEGILVYAVYAVGMGLPIVITTILVYRAKEYAIRRMVRYTRWFHTIGGGILIIIGIYLIFYYFYVFA
jgi:cytochrome c biogenesis protein CcdA